MFYLFAALGLILFVFGLYKMLNQRKKTDRTSASQPDAQEDEYLYDPKTGKRITLEEAMHGYEVEQDTTETDTSAETAKVPSLSEEEVAALRIRNWMMLENFGLVTEEQAEALLSSIGKSSIMQAYGDKMDYLFSSSPDAGLYLMVMYVSPEMGHGREGGNMGEHQLLGLLKLAYFSGKAILEPTTATNSLLDPYKTAHKFSTEKHTIYTEVEENLPAPLVQLEATLQGMTHYTAEVYQEHLIIKSHNAATAEEADDLLQCLLKVKRALND